MWNKMVTPFCAASAMKVHSSLNGQAQHLDLELNWVQGCQGRSAVLGLLATLSTQL